MNLFFRRMVLDDIPQCHALPLIDGFAYDAPTFRRIPDLWRQLISEGSAIPWVIKDKNRRPGTEIVLMEMGVFVTDAFVAASCATLPPYTGRNILEMWLAGRSPLLALPAVRAANSGSGLNMICLHTATLMPLDRPEFLPAHEKNFEAYRQMCAGYNYKQLLVEVYGREQMQWNLNAGMRLRSDYREATRPADMPSLLDHEPYLIGSTREEAAATFGSVLATFFRHAPPRFFFSSREQELLEAALIGLSDDESAAALCISHPTVRKRWESIYGKVSLAAPDMLGGETDLPSPRAGAQKKRLLLSYLRDHPEELRPILPPK